MELQIDPMVLTLVRLLQIDPNGINTCKAMYTVINLCINNNLSYRDSLAKDYLNIIEECEKRRKETACESFYVNLT